MMTGNLPFNGASGNKQKSSKLSSLKFFNTEKRKIKR